MMMHDEGTALYDLFADALLENLPEIAFITVLMVTLVITTAFVLKVISTEVRRPQTGQSHVDP